jgi:hypothetical protein
VFECYLGRLLTSEEIVHHRNRNKIDNQYENLELHTRDTHGLEHGPETRERSTAALTEDQVRKALEGRTTLEASRLLNVNHQTLRNRFAGLISKRRSPGSEFDPDFVERLRTLAADPTVSTRRAAAVLNCAQATMRECRRIHGIQWVSAPLGRPSRKA